MDFQISDSTIAEVRAIEEANKPYWRLFLNNDDELCVVCLQPFDECDYDQNRFINEIRYETEEQAGRVLLAFKLRYDRKLSILEMLKIARFLEEGER